MSSSTASAAALSLFAGASLAVMGFFVYDAVSGGEDKGSSSPPPKIEGPIEVRAEFPAPRESVQFFIAENEIELRRKLEEVGLRYDINAISYAILVAPGRCMVLLHIDDVSNEIRDYEVRRCRRMLDNANRFQAGAGR